MARPEGVNIYRSGKNPHRQVAVYVSDSEAVVHLVDWKNMLIKSWRTERGELPAHRRQRRK